MVDRSEVHESADELRSRGKVVSQASIRARLEEKTGRGGSFRDVGPYLLEWKAERTYPRPLGRSRMASPRGPRRASIASRGKASPTRHAAGPIPRGRAPAVGRTVGSTSFPAGGMPWDGHRRTAGRTGQASRGSPKPFPRKPRMLHGMDVTGGDAAPTPHAGPARRQGSCLPAWSAPPDGAPGAAGKGYPPGGAPVPANGGSPARPGPINGPRAPDGRRTVGST